MSTLAGGNVHAVRQPPRIPKTIRIRPKAIADVNHLGDDAASRFGEGDRPEFGEIARLLLSYALRDPGIRRQVRQDLVNARIKR